MMAHKYIALLLLVVLMTCFTTTTADAAAYAYQCSPTATTDVATLGNCARTKISAGPCLYDLPSQFVYCVADGSNIVPLTECSAVTDADVDPSKFDLETSPDTFEEIAETGLSFDASECSKTPIKLCGLLTSPAPVAGTISTTDITDALLSCDADTMAIPATVGSCSSKEAVRSYYQYCIVKAAGSAVTETNYWAPATDCGGATNTNVAVSVDTSKPCVAENQVTSDFTTCTTTTKSVCHNPWDAIQDESLSNCDTSAITVYETPFTETMSPDVCGWATQFSTNLITGAQLDGEIDTTKLSTTTPAAADLPVVCGKKQRYYTYCVFLTKTPEGVASKRYADLSTCTKQDSALGISQEIEIGEAVQCETFCAAKSTPYQIGDVIDPATAEPCDLHTIPPQSGCAEETVSRKSFCARKISETSYTVLNLDAQCSDETETITPNFTYPAKTTPECAIGWKCALDPKSTAFADFVSCDDARFVSKCANTCLNVDMSSNAKCIYETSAADGTIQEGNCTGMELAKYNCSCDTLCRPTGSTADFTQCTEDAANWTAAAACGEIDRREAVFKTKTGNTLATCTTGVDCDLSLLPPTTRFPANAAILCKDVVSLKCEPGAEPSQNSADYIGCDQDGGYPQCTDENCGTMLARNVQCFIQDEFTAEYVDKTALDSDMKTQYNDVLSTICDNVKITAALSTTKHCDCSNILLCVAVDAADPPEKGDYQTCANDFGFSTCSARCIGDDMVQSRPVFCRNTDGTYTPVNSAEELSKSPCVAEEAVDFTKSCVGTEKCQVQYFCNEYNTQTPFTNGEIAPEFICSPNNWLSEVCYQSTEDTSNPFTEDHCIIEGVSTGTHYRLRDVQCIVYKPDSDAAENTYPSVDTPPNDVDAFCAASLPEGESPPLSAVPDTTEGVDKCADQEGCPEVLESVELSKTADVPEFSTLAVNWAYIGPIASQKPVKLEYAYAVTSAMDAPALEWIAAPDFDGVVISKKTAGFTIPKLDRELNTKLFIRMSITDESVFVYAPELVVSLVDNCETIMCLGPNLDEPVCALDEATQEPECQCRQPINPTTFTSTDDSLPCQRTAACDAASATTCQSNGYFPYDADLTSDNQCSTTCICPGGHSTPDCSGICAIQNKYCQQENGKPFSDTAANCKCQKCWRGHSGEFCEYCTKYSAILITEPSADAIAAFAAANTSNAYALKTMFIRNIKNFVVSKTAYDAKYVSVDPEMTSYNATSKELTVIFKFVGVCETADESVSPLQTVFETRSFTPFTVTAAAPPQLSTVDAKWAAIQQSDVEASHAFEQVKTASSTASVVSDATNIIPAEVIDCSVDPENVVCPAKKKTEDKHTITILVAVVCSVAGVFIIAIVVTVLYTTSCWKSNRSGDSEDPPAVKKSSAPNSDENNHLELF